MELILKYIFYISFISSNKNLYHLLTIVLLHDNRFEIIFLKTSVNASIKQQQSYKPTLHMTVPNFQFLFKKILIKADAIIIILEIFLMITRIYLRYSNIQMIYIFMIQCFRFYLTAFKSYILIDKVSFQDFYIQKIFHSHSNFLCSKKINLIDYYFMDPRYQELCNDPIESLQFDLEYYEPTQLDETYHELQRNGRHQKILSGIFQIKKIQIIDDNSTSALELSRNLLNMQTQSFSPLMDILKYRILINRGLQANSQQTKNIIIGLHLKSLNILKSQKEQFVALHIFERFYDDVIGDTIENNNFNLFQLETIDPIILVELLQIESRNNQQSSKRKQQFQLKLLSDVLSMRQIENNDFIQGYPLNYNSKILSESLAQDSQLTSGILIFLQIILNLQLILQ
ncbi:unnamed protein product [Paramecium octaurelia]|uniref:Transmembrane protein n=1 Tax=Paramecium octaurelia TaxID=43137 RepID=A0A8S1UWM2_PAROT|nr:unnamed protein product [Paramecium octaurelia]